MKGNGTKKKLDFFFKGVIAQLREKRFNKDNTELVIPKCFQDTEL